MSGKLATSGIKRSVDSLTNANQPTKRFKGDASIRDYMKPRPQQRRNGDSKLKDPKVATKFKKSAIEDAQSGGALPAEEPERSINTSPASPPSNSTPNNPTTLTLLEQTGNIFSAPSNTLLIHACNCEGSWGAGIAAAFKKHCPGAFEIYAAHCRTNTSEFLPSTALLIPPQVLNKSTGGHFVGCLFTSRSKGRKKDTPGQILDATGPAMRDLLGQVRRWNESHGAEKKVGEVRMCRINSGLFAVPWKKTVEVLEGIEVDGGEGGEGFDVKEIKVISREE